MKTPYDPTKHLKIEMKFKNGSLMQLMELHHLSARALSKETKIAYGDLLDFINLKKSPCLKHPDSNGHIFSKSAVKIAEYFHLSPTDIFPPETWKTVEKNEFSFYWESTKKSDKMIDRDERSLLCYGLSQLTDCEREVVMAIFGLGCSKMTVADIARTCDKTPYRISSIANRALRKLRHTSRLGRFRNEFSVMFDANDHRDRKPAMRVGL